MATSVSSPYIDPAIAIAINALLERPPAGVGFTGAEIEEIFHAKNLFFYQEEINQGTYLDDFLSSFEWWLKVFHAVWGSKADSVCMDTEMDIEHTLVPEILSLYSTAWAARYLVDAVGSDPTGLELVKRYCQFRQWVCALAKPFLTDAEFEQLSAAK